LGWIDLGAWLVTLAELAPRLRDTAFEPLLAGIAVLGSASAVMWVRRMRGWRAAVLGTAIFYLVCWAARLYRLEVEPLLAILPLAQAVADAIYVIWSSPMGRLSHGEVLDAATELWRQCVMPLFQAAMLGVASRRSS
jgi:hypothetical protein